MAAPLPGGAAGQVLLDNSRGLAANYTFLHSSGVPQSTLSSTDPDVGAGRVTNQRRNRSQVQDFAHRPNIARAGASGTPQ